MSEGPPPVILVTVDALRSDVVFGSSRQDGFAVETPALQTLADRGTTFETALSTAPGTSGSMPGILASQYRMETGSMNQYAEGWLAEELQGVGYGTVGLYNNPRLRPEKEFHRGFDEYGKHGRISSRTEGVKGKGDDEVFDIRDAIRALANQTRTSYRALKTIQLLRDPPYTGGEALTDKASGYLNGGSAGPKFLWLHYMDVHDPYMPEQDCQESVGLLPTSKLKAAYLNTHLNIVTGSRWSRETPDRPTIERLRDLYRAEVRCVDRCIGKLLDTLRDAGLLEEAIVVVTSDHGELFLEHDGIRHGWDLYEELINVPLIVKPPGSEPRSDSVSGIVSTLDIAPTILDYAGESIPDYMQGRSLRPAIEGGRSDREYAYAHHITRDPDRGPVRKAMIHSGGSKYIVDEESKERRLYDLTTDAGESTNVLADHGETAAVLADSLEHEFDWSGWDGERWNAEVESPSRSVKRQLENLGYT